MVRIITVMLIGRTFLAVVLAMAFAMHSPMLCGMARETCHHNSSSDAANHPCCNTVSCDSALDSNRNALTPAPSLTSVPMPALVALQPRHQFRLDSIFVAARTPSPPAGTPLVIELRTLLI